VYIESDMRSLLETFFVDRTLEAPPPAHCWSHVQSIFEQRAQPQTSATLLNLRIALLLLVAGTDVLFSFLKQSSKHVPRLSFRGCWV
jgi:hypothetical protein